MTKETKDRMCEAMEVLKSICKNTFICWECPMREVCDKHMDITPSNWKVPKGV